MPRETFTHSATTPTGISDVWDALEQPETWQGIAGVDRVYNPHIDSDGHLQGFSFETVVGGRKYLGRATPHERDKHRVMALNIQNPELVGVIRVELSEEEGGTRVTVTLDVTSAGFLSSMFFPVIAKTLGTGLPRTVQDFVAGFDGGD